jgi:hypothetical protein
MLYSLIRAENHLIFYNENFKGLELLSNKDYYKSVIMNIRIDDSNEPINDINELMSNPIKIMNLKCKSPFVNECISI